MQTWFGKIRLQHWLFLHIFHGGWQLFLLRSIKCNQNWLIMKKLHDFIKKNANFSEKINLKKSKWFFGLKIKFFTETKVEMDGCRNGQAYLYPHTLTPLACVPLGKSCPYGYECVPSMNFDGHQCCSENFEFPFNDAAILKSSLFFTIFIIQLKIS